MIYHIKWVCFFKKIFQNKSRKLEKRSIFTILKTLFLKKNIFTDPNASSVMNFDCMLVQVSRDVIENVERDIGAKYKFECDEKYQSWGLVTLAFVFAVPGLSQWLLIIIPNRSTFKKIAIKKNGIHCGLDVLGFFLIPFFQLQVIFFKSLAVLTKG